MRAITIAAMALALSACVSASNVNPVNQPLATAAPAAEADLGVDGDAVVLSFSGGGARAAAFSYGALLEMRDMHAAAGGALVDRVALVTAVSGGAITAAYFGQHGSAGLDGFRAAALDQDWVGELHTSLIAPANWLRAYKGGVNGRDRLADWLDAHVYHGGAMHDLPHRPRIVLNATEIYTGAPFAFVAPYFDAICSNLGDVRIADAVAASMSVPLAFKPVVVGAYAAACKAPLPDWVAAAAQNRAAPALLRQTARAFQLYRDPERLKYLHLADGGVVDNYGLSSLITMRQASAPPYGPFSARDAVRAHRVVFLVVNAEQTLSGKWQLSAQGPGGVEAIEAALNDSINANKRIAYEAFAATLDSWRHDLIAYRCALPKADAARLGAGAGWKCDDVSFTLDSISFADLEPAQGARLAAAPTQVSLPPALIDDLIAGGRTAVTQNPALKSLTAR